MVVARVVVAVSGAGLALLVSVYALVPAINPKFGVMPQAVIPLLIVLGVLALVWIIAVDQTIGSGERDRHGAEVNAAEQSGGVPERRPVAGALGGR